MSEALNAASQPACAGLPPRKTTVALVAEHHCTVQAKQGCRHSLDLAAVQETLGTDAFWSTFVAVYAVTQGAISKSQNTKKYQKPAAWTSFPLTEGEPVQSANFWFFCNLLHMHSSAVDLLFQKFWAEFGAF